MVILESKRGLQSGFSQGGVLWLAVIVGLGMLIKSEFFPGISKGSSTDDLLYRLGQPVSKVAVPRPH